MVPEGGPLVSSDRDRVERGMEIDKVCCGPLGSPLPHPGGTGYSQRVRVIGKHRERDKEREGEGGIRCLLAYYMHDV